MIDWMKDAVTEPDSPEAKLLRQKIGFIGLLFLLGAVAGAAPIFADWSLPIENAIFIAIVGIVLIVIDRVDTRLGLKMTGANVRVNNDGLEWNLSDGTPVQGTLSTTESISGQPHRAVPTTAMRDAPVGMTAALADDADG